jgi:hypothetical protein
VRYCRGSFRRAIRRAREVHPRWIHSGSKATGSARQRDAADRPQTRTLDFAGFEPPPEFQDGLERIAARKYSRESSVQEFLHSLDGLLLQPLRSVSLHHMTMGINEAGHDGHAFRVDCLRSWRVCRNALGKRDDPPIPNNDRPARDGPAVAVNDPRVSDHQTLGRETLDGAKGTEQRQTDARAQPNNAPTSKPNIRA